MLRAVSGLSLLVGLVAGQVSSSWPQDYPGKPSGDFSPAWQNYFEVTQPLPNVSFPLARSFAGNLPVDRQGHSNDTLFFWAFEKQNGSLADTNSTEPWGIWLNGGPGSSSLVGLFIENGPLHVAGDYSIHGNNFSWNRLADYVWIDQPVGTGFSTADAHGFIDDEDQMGIDFMNFLANLVKVFPGLKTRPLHLTGESYAGTYIPYITKAYFGLQSPPVNLAKIAIGDGTITNVDVFEQLPTISVIETYPQLIGYDTEVYQYFKEQWHLCGYDLNLTYPQHGNFPTLDTPGGGTGALQLKKKYLKQALISDAQKRSTGHLERAIDGARLAKRAAWKRDLAGRANGTIDPWYKCNVYGEMMDYALNFSLPWKGNTPEGFDVYNVPDALQPEAPADPSVFLNDNRTRAAIHAPTSKDWEESILYPFGSSNDNFFADPSFEPMAFLTDLATNATERGVHVVISAGNDDSLVPHLGSEVAIQNTTFGGIQGFSRRPSTPWFSDDGSFAGIVHQERNWTYVLFHGAGHLVPQQRPDTAFVFLREFVLGSNQTGLVTNTSGTVSVVGGENATLAAPIMPGQLGIYVGSLTTTSTYTYPSATIAAWDSFYASITAAAATGTGSADGAVKTGNGASRQASPTPAWSAFLVVGLIAALFVW